ncbi:MAG: GNAT family N-acetyltransferase [Pseudomonadota bacterium]
MFKLPGNTWGASFYSGFSANFSMTDMSRFRDPSDLGDAVQIAALEIEDLSQARYIHAAAFRLMASPFFTDDEISAFIETITSTGYSDSLVAAMRESQLIGARLNSELVGTAGWMYGEDQGETARLKWLYVRPLFNDCGIGRRLVSEVELRATRAGFKQMSVRSTTTSAGFFERLGYHTTSHGVRNLSANVSMPVIFMRKTLTSARAVTLTKH